MILLKILFYKNKNNRKKNDGFDLSINDKKH